jgi:hypothetical protein
VTIVKDGDRYRVKGPMTQQEVAALFKGTELSIALR